MKSIIFFDINGTIIARDSRTDLPFGNAINQLLETTDAMAGVDTSARSDHDVFMEVLENHGIAYTEKLWHDFLLGYQVQLEAFKTTDVWRENDEAIRFIKYLSEKGYLLSLITGELSIGAQYKLEKLGVWQYFESGGFGEDGLKRFDIAEAALQKAQQLYGEGFDRMFVIGDTMLDIATARHIGAEIIAITTGSHSRDQLAEKKPDYLIDGFKEIWEKF